uniref:Protein kinase domain-containing protein n=1 Tax=Schistocephalus solidus TaxID=70667 RepID=A0A183SZ49_SCHSO
LDEDCIAFVTRETLRGVKHMHSLNRIHRDIKGANILLTDAGCVKIADFGVAAKLSSSMVRRCTVIGTPYWMAPEVASVESRGSGYDSKCDIWAVGITAIEYAELQPPLFDMDPLMALQLLGTRNYKPPTLKNPRQCDCPLCLGGIYFAHEFVTNPGLSVRLTCQLLEMKRAMEAREMAALKAPPPVAQARAHNPLPPKIIPQMEPSAIAHRDLLSTPFMHPAANMDNHSQLSDGGYPQPCRPAPPTDFAPLRAPAADGVNGDGGHPPAIDEKPVVVAMRISSLRRDDLRAMPPPLPPGPRAFPELRMLPEYCLDQSHEDLVTEVFDELQKRHSRLNYPDDNHLAMLERDTNRLSFYEGEDYPESNDVTNFMCTDLLETEEFKKQVNNVNRAIDKLRKAGALKRKEALTAKTTDAAMARFYGLLKVYKPGVPLHPIVSLRGTPTFGLSKWLYQWFCFLTEGSEWTVKSAEQFLRSIRHLEIDSDETTLSFVPTGLAVSTVAELLQEKYDEIAQQFKRKYFNESLELCLRTFFSFNDRIYEQKKRTPMGSPVWTYCRGGSAEARATGLPGDSPTLTPPDVSRSRSKRQAPLPPPLPPKGELTRMSAYRQASLTAPGPLSSDASSSSATITDPHPQSPSDAANRRSLVPPPRPPPPKCSGHRSPAALPQPSPTTPSAYSKEQQLRAEQHSQMERGIGLPPVPKVHMGACFSLIFEGCPLKVNATATWVNPSTNAQVIIFGTNDGIYYLNLQELAD